MAQWSGGQIAAAVIGGVVLLGVIGSYGKIDSPRIPPEPAASAQPDRAAVTRWLGARERVRIGCSSGLLAVGTAMEALGKGRGDAADAWQLADTAARECRAARAADWPAAPDGVTVPKAVAESCDSWLLMAGATAEAMKVVIDGDLRPSARADLRSSVEAMAAFRDECQRGEAALGG